MNKFFSSQAEPDASLEDKLSAYYIYSLIKLAPLEAAGIFSIVAMLLNQSYIYLTFIVIALLVFLMLRPTEEKVSGAKSKSAQRRTGCRRAGKAELAIALSSGSWK